MEIQLIQYIACENGENSQYSNIQKGKIFPFGQHKVFQNSRPKIFQNSRPKIFQIKTIFPKIHLERKESSSLPPFYFPTGRYRHDRLFNTGTTEKHNRYTVPLFLFSGIVFQRSFLGNW